MLARNWRRDGGELDLVVERDAVVRFVEVKARRIGDGLDAIGPAKRRRLVGAANAWLAAYPDPVDEVAFVVAMVHLAPRGGWSVTLIDDPFDG